MVNINLKNLPVDASVLGTEIWAKPGQVPALTEYQQDRNAPDVQRKTDEGVPLWRLTAFILDPETTERNSVTTIKIASKTPPVVPARGGFPLTRITFEGLMATPWISDRDGRSRMQYSFTATGVHPVPDGAPQSGRDAS